jgi:hypothetical protein
LKTIGDYILYGKINIYDKNGMVYTEFGLLATNVILNPLLLLVDPFYGYYILYFIFLKKSIRK